MHKLPLLPEVVIYTDGACYRNGKPGALASAAAVILKDGEAQAVGEFMGHGTSQRAEVTAAIIGLRALKEQSRVTIYTDSKYLVNGATGEWARHVNTEYWNKLDDLSKRHYVTYVWVRGHDGDYWNETADSLAVAVLDSRRVDQERLDEIVRSRLERAPALHLDPCQVKVRGV